MKLEIDLDDLSLAKIAEALGEKMKSEGLLWKSEPRTVPYTLNEAAEALNVSTRTVENEIAAGRLVRIPGIGKVLITVDSVRAYQAGKPNKSMQF